MKDHHIAWHGLRFLVAGALALVIVLAILYASLFYLSASSESAKKSPPAQYTESQKLDILHNLAASSSESSVASKKKTLQGMQSTTSASVSESQKLDILRGLHN